MLENMDHQVLLLLVKRGTLKTKKLALVVSLSPFDGGEVL